MTQTPVSAALDLKPLDRITPRSWQSLTSKRVFFGHHSVGDNLIEGMRDIMGLKPGLALRFVDVAQAGAVNEPAFAHGRVGVNKDPESKIQDFERQMTDSLGQRVDIAFFKFCYVDIGPGTDVGRLFESYEKSAQGLAARFPKVRMAHVTSPLTAPPGGLKNTLKRIAGKLTWEHEANIRREKFNTLMRGRYASAGSLFDLARAESARPDGSTESFGWQGTKHPVLARCYAADEGHLGPLGRQAAAREMMIWLAGFASPGEAT